MAVVPLTLTISLCLVFVFVMFFLREHARGRLSNAERDSLLPLAEETPRLAHARMPSEANAHRGSCHDGSQAPVPAGDRGRAEAGALP